MRLNLTNAVSICILTIIIAAFTAVKAQSPGTGAAPPCVPDPLAEDAVLEWNCRASNYAVSATFASPLRQIRAMAIVQLSVHNAVNGITGKYETYVRNTANVPPDGASAEAAAVGAAYQALYAIVTPAQRVTLDAELAASLTARGIPTDDPSLLYGRNEGQNVFNLRASDGSGAAAACAYVDIVDPQPGDWVRINNEPASLPCWKYVTLFVLNSADQFPLDDPPALDSEKFATDFNEIMNYGVWQNSSRSPEQTAMADFWDGTPVGINNQAFRQAAAGQGKGLSDEARAFALIYITGTDASVACWYQKYDKLFWRPETSVNYTFPGGNWKPYLHSHPHPEYPSGHTTNSGSMLAAAGLVFGDEPGVTMSPTTIRDGRTITPEWESFSEGINEVINARVYSGLHYRFTDEASAHLAKRIANFVHTHALRKCTPGNKCG
jgi:hypothetical protein